MFIFTPSSQILILTTCFRWLFNKTTIVWRVNFVMRENRLGIWSYKLKRYVRMLRGLRKRCWIVEWKLVNGLDEWRNEADLLEDLRAWRLDTVGGVIFDSGNV